VGLACLAAVAGCSPHRSPATTSPASRLLPSATPWPEADALFHRDPRWLGSDDAYSVDLGRGRVLWLFGDTFVAPSGTGDRSGAVMVRNAIAIEQGYDPSSASIAFHWGKDPSGRPADFFPGSGNTWCWPGGAVRLATAGGGSALLLFMMQTQSSRGDLGFATTGWRAFYVPNPEAEPAQWKVQPVAAPQNVFGAIVGSGAVLPVDDRLVAFSPDDSAHHDVYVAGWPLAAAARGDLSAITYWTGRAWEPAGATGATPAVVMTGAQSELSVHRDPSSGQYVLVQTVGFGSTTIGMRTAPAVTGPWSQPVTVYTPPESSRSGVLVYAAKAHPELRGADLVLTYASNHTDLGTVVRDPTLYFPRFVRLAYGSGGPGTSQ
jgi:Domain of unknown function (DUF4185)